MTDEACSRREFLKKFARLSGGALMLSATAIACDPLPNVLPSIIGIYCYDAAMQKIELRGNNAVPVHTQFEFVFSTDMDITWPADVAFVDLNGTPVGFTEGWFDARTLILTPFADLSFNTDYLLTVKDADDAHGNPLNDYANASAAFRTASA